MNARGNYRLERDYQRASCVLRAVLTSQLVTCHCQLVRGTEESGLHSLRTPSVSAAESWRDTDTLIPNLNTFRLASLSSCSTNLTGNFSSQVSSFGLLPCGTFAHQQQVLTLDCFLVDRTLFPRAFQIIIFFFVVHDNFTASPVNYIICTLNSTLYISIWLSVLCENLVP